MMQSRRSPEWLVWLRSHARNPESPTRLRKGDLAALTGQDVRVLNAIAACWQLYMASDEDGGRAALASVRALLPALQAQCRFIARELIAWAGDWGHRDKLWPLVQPDDFTPTHEITLTRHVGDVKDVEVVEVMLVDGAAYTRAEWKSQTNAEWTRDADGQWHWRDQTAPGDNIEVRVFALNSSSTNDAEAELHAKRLDGVE